MVGRSETTLSRAPVLRAEKRLSHQEAMVSHLGHDSAVRGRSSASGLHSIMRSKLDRLLRQQDDLLAATREGSPCQTTS